MLDLTTGAFSCSVSHGRMDAEGDDKAKFALYVRDKFSLSHQAYHELISDLPRSYKIKQKN